MKFMSKVCFVLLLTLCGLAMNAQRPTGSCPAIACNDNVQISLDNMCAGVTLDMLIEGSFDQAVKIFVTGQDGKTASATSPSLDDEFYLNDTTLFNWSPYVGELVKYTIVSECDGNSCWGETKLEINQLPSLESPCKVTPGAVVEEVFTFEEVIAGPVTFTYPINDATCQIPATVTHSGDLLYACSLGDDGIIGTSDDGWCTASCNVIDDLAGTITVVFDPSLGDPTGVAIPASAVCKIKVEVPDCTSCTAWCSEDGTRSYPDGFVTLDDINEMIESGCFANIEGDIIKVEDIKGDACESITTVFYYANVSLHGNVEKVLLLEQAFKTVKLDPNHLNAPNGPVILDCGSVSNDALPDEIFAETGSGSLAFPWFQDKHTLLPHTVEICGLDHYNVVVDTMEQLVAVDVDTDKDGVDDSQVWVLLPVVQKELRDSTYCEIVEIATDGGIIVYDAEGDCLGDGTDFILMTSDSLPVVITSPAAFVGNGAIAPGSTTCDNETTPAIVHIENGKYCNLIVSYSDQGPFEACGSGFKIIRTWQALDWCDGTVGGIHLGSQFIEVIDTEAPVFPSLVDDAVSIDPWTCFAKYPLNIPTADDGCEGTTISYDIDVSAGRYDAESGYIVDLYPQDSIAIIVEVADDCFNVALDTFTLTVFDGVAPVPVCHENLTVTLTTGGLAKVFAEDFDAGSHDAGCGDVKIYAARMTGCCDDECAGGDKVCLEYDKFGECIEEGNSPETDEYGDFVKFCCQDAGTQVMVAILVVDAAGNKNTCMIEVTVVDKSAVTLACEDVTISCQDDIDEVSHASAIAAVCEGGTPDLYSETFNETGCGTGGVIREWWIDKDGDGVLSSGDAYCEQTITILPGEEHAFDPYTIKWPVHYTGEVYEGINLECDDEGELRTFDGEKVPMGDVFACSSADLDIAPVWCSSPCGLVGYSVEEETVVASDACLKVIKRWTVIDWCKWDPNGSTPVDDANDSDNDSFIAVADWTTPDCYGCEDNQADPYYFKYDTVDKDGYYTFDQVIKVIDDSDPSIEVVDSFVQSADGGASNKNDDTKCVGEGTLTAVARDQCGGEDSGAEFLSWVIERYENGELAATNNATGETVEMSTGAGGPGDVHKIVWRASDGCGNSTKSETEVTFDDSKAPTPLCVSGVTTAFMEATGSVDIWANDFDLGSFDNCTDLTFTMVPSGVDPAQPGSEEFDSQKSYSLICDDVTSFIEFNVWVWDANGLGDFCTVGVLVGGECNPGEEASGLMIAGNMQTEFGDMIEGVNTVINAAALSEFPKSLTTGENGQYVFANNPSGYDFNINASRNDNAINGVSTLDLVLIQKHILGITSFESAYKVIASDANNDENVTASDLLVLRRLILGIDMEFANNESWRFISANAPIISKTNPWPFTESIHVNNLIENQMNENFIGIKIGDVNGNAVPNSLSTSETRSAGLVSFEADNAELTAGQIVRVPVSSSSFNHVFGFQFTAEFNGLTYRGIESGTLDVSEQNLGQFGNKMTMSWENAEAVSTSETLFTLVFEATSDLQLSQALSINSNKINSEMYVGNSLEVYTVDMAFNTSSDILEMSLSQNDPNPFSVQTTISFVLPQQSNATLQITNVSGEVIRSISGEYNKGLNSIILSKEELNLTTGLYYYTLESNQHSMTKKMIVVSE